MYLLSCKHIINESIQLFPMLINDTYYIRFLISREFRPSYIYLLLPILLYPYLCNSIASMGPFPPSAHDMNMPSVFRSISGKDRQDEI